MLNLRNPKDLTLQRFDVNYRRHDWRRQITWKCLRMNVANLLRQNPYQNLPRVIRREIRTRALSNNIPTDCLNTIQCRAEFAELISYGWTVALQWVPSHVGIPGNERADQKAKQGAESSQLEVSLTLRRVKGIIFTFIDKYTTEIQNTKSHGKLLSLWIQSRGTWRAESVACLRLTTAHDFWEYASTGLTCLLCRMDADHLLQCAGLDEYPTDDIVSRYWEALRQMVKPSTGVG
ncbi:reverse transcriptase [Trichonephila clavipes]|nr:reverse transcriptase [Trichonephila clavipes]